MTITLTALPRVARPRRVALDLPGIIRAAWEEGLRTGSGLDDAPESLWRASNASCDAAFVEENGDVP